MILHRPNLRINLLITFSLALVSMKSIRVTNDNGNDNNNNTYLVSAEDARREISSGRFDILVTGLSRFAEEDIDALLYLSVIGDYYNGTFHIVQILLCVCCVSPLQMSIQNKDC